MYDNPAAKKLLPLPSLLECHEMSASADILQPFLVECRRHIHAHPEVGFEEHETAHFVRTLLEAAGFAVHEATETGSWVEIKGAHQGPTVAYRADLDALPMQDEKDSEYASKHSGVAHLCGHDAHTTIALAVALLAQRFSDSLHGTLRVFFQPNEEGLPSGAPEMLSLIHI